MSQFKHGLSARDKHITSLRIICATLFALLVLTMIGWMNSPKQLTVHVPPDLRNGSTKPWWEIPPSTAYTFGFYILQQLNSWPTNGEVDYESKIHSLTNYLTPACSKFLFEDAKQRKFSGELRDRVRGIYEIPGRGFKQESVQVIDRDRLIVNLDLVVDEYYLTEAVKRALVRYPLYVVRWNIDPEKNPFGLALDCYASTPQRLETDANLASPLTKR